MRIGNLFAPGLIFTVAPQATAPWPKGYESTLPVSPTASQPSIAHCWTMIGFIVVFMSTTVAFRRRPATTWWTGRTTLTLIGGAGAAPAPEAGRRALAST